MRYIDSAHKPLTIDPKLMANKLYTPIKLGLWLILAIGLIVIILTATYGKT